MEKNSKDLKHNNKKRSRSRSKSCSKDCNNDSGNESDIIKTEDEIAFLLDDKKRLTIRKFKGKLLIDIREFYEADGEKKPGKKGIALSLQNWQKLNERLDAINTAIENMK